MTERPNRRVSDTARMRARRLIAAQTTEELIEQLAFVEEPANALAFALDAEIVSDLILEELAERKSLFRVGVCDECGFDLILPSDGECRACGTLFPRDRPGG